MTDRPIRALIADDEALARKFIRRMLKENRDFEIIGECSNGKETVAMIRKERPDVVFLDVQMPEMDGLAVLESIGIEQLPEIIFTTAYEQYAIRAFEVHALDYLLKPLTQKRLAECLSRLDALRPGAHRNRLEEVRRDDRTLERLMARSGSKLLVVNVKDVIAFES